MVESARNAGDLVWEDPLGEGMAAHTSNLGQRSLVGYSPRGHKESDRTEN